MTEISTSNTIVNAEGDDLNVVYKIKRDENNYPVFKQNIEGEYLLDKNCNKQLEYD